jgi:hypothetical protein
MTKYFYVDRTLPKKKLTQSEMIEINSLYRTIGDCERQIAKLRRPTREDVMQEAQVEPESQAPVSARLKSIPRTRYLLAGSGIVLVLALYAAIKKRSGGRV